jgi:spore coat protein U-like protein
MFDKSFMRAAVLGMAAIVGTGLAADADAAGTAQGQLNVTALVANNCIIDANDTLAFGTYDPIVTHKTNPLNVNGTINITCTSGASVTVTLNGGANASAGQRRLVGATPTNFLNYNLFTDVGYLTAFAPDGSVGKGSTGTGSSVPITVYGQVPAGQDTVAADSYTDTVVTTVTF